MRSLLASLFALIVVSALAVVHTRHQFRVTFVAVQDAYKERDQLNAEWSQLLLEQSTWAFHHLVEKKARSRLGMTVPEPDSIEVVTEP